MLRECILARSHLDTVLKVVGDRAKFARFRENVSIALAEVDAIQAEIAATAALRRRIRPQDCVGRDLDRSNDPLPIRAGRCGSWEDSHCQGLTEASLSPAFDAAAAMEVDLVSREERDVKASRINDAIEQVQLSVAYQPIYMLSELRIVGLECLSRFPTPPARAPTLWFSEAAEVGRQVELELLAIRIALREVSILPSHIYVALNVSPETVLSGGLPAALDATALERVVLEITEHASVEDYVVLTRALEPLRNRGMRIAVDDAGAGYASLRHVLHLKPEMIKLDMELTRSIDQDRARRALASALTAFARETGSLIIAEGVEAATELDVLRRLGVHQAQGYVFSKPIPLAEILHLLDQGQGVEAPRDS